MSQNKMRAYVFTLNNPQAALLFPDYIRYAVYQKECVTTPHFQGYIELSKPQRITALKKWLPTAHFESRKGTREQARDYAMKEESRVEGPWEHGEFIAGQGHRTDIADVRDAILAGASRAQILADFPEVIAKYPRFVDFCGKIRAEQSVDRIVEFTARYPWQEKVLEVIAAPVVDRQIVWVFDPFGNSGKTYMSKYLVDSKSAFYCNGGKSSDLVYAYNGEPIVVFDYVRDAKDYVGYGVIEQLKNGILFSAKYESGMKRFEVPHVLVFANFRPEAGKFSEDRLLIIELNSTHQTI